MIVKTPGTCGGRARIDGTRLSISFLITLRRLGVDIDDYPNITKQMMNEAVKYYSNNIEEIEKEKSDIIDGQI